MCLSFRIEGGLEIICGKMTLLGKDFICTCIILAFAKGNINVARQQKDSVRVGKDKNCELRKRGSLIVICNVDR